MIFESHDGLFAVIDVAIMIAVGEPRPDFSQIARPDWLTAEHTERLLAGRPAIHQYESHVAPSKAKQDTVSDGWKRLGGGGAEVVSTIGIVPIPLHLLMWNGNVLSVFAAFRVDVAVNVLDFKSGGTSPHCNS